MQKIALVSLVERISARTRAFRVRVVDLESGGLNGVFVIDRRALEVRSALPVDDNLDAVECDDGVTVERSFVKEEVVAESAAAAGLDNKPEAQIVPLLAAEKSFCLVDGRGGERNSVGVFGQCVSY